MPVFEVTECSTPDEYAATLEVTVAAFQDYKLFAWIARALPDPSVFPRYMINVIRHLCQLPDGRVYAAREVGSQEIIGAAQISTYHGLHSVALLAALQSVWRDVSFLIKMRRFIFVDAPFSVFKRDDANRLTVMRFKSMQKLDEVRMRHVGPREHMYLYTVATSPAHQGKGVGGALLNAVNAVADAKGLPTWLETDEPHLAVFYAKFGFKVVEEYEVRCGNEVFTPNFGMLREPVPQSKVALT